MHRQFVAKLGADCAISASNVRCYWYQQWRSAKRLKLPVQRESFDVIGKVGFGRDFQASKDIDNPVNTFQQLTDDLEESVTRLINPWRKYSLSKVWRWILSPILPSFAAMHKHPGDVAGTCENSIDGILFSVALQELSVHFALYSDAGLMLPQRVYNLLV